MPMDKNVMLSKRLLLFKELVILDVKDFWQGRQGF
jgi:hypothetical protein